MPCYLFYLFIQACAVGFDDILISVKGILFVAFQRTGAVIVAVAVVHSVVGLFYAVVRPNRVLLFFLDLFQIGERNPAFPLPAALELFLVSL